jgi:hypothetical protein
MSAERLRLALIEHGWALTRAKARDKAHPATHYSLNKLLGTGILHVPYADLDRFYAILAASKDAPISLSEVRSPEAFPYYADLDVPGDLENDEVLALVREMAQDVAAFFPGRRVGRAVVAVARDPAVPSQRLGVHVVFPDALVTQERALWIRQASVERLAYDHPGRPWHDIVDESVLRAPTGGLRPLFCHKAASCGECDGRFRSSLGATEAPCAGCGGEGYLDKQRPYAVVALLGPDGARDEAETARLLASPVRALQAMSLRRREGTAPTEGWEPPAGATAPPPVRAKRPRASDKAYHTGDPLVAGVGQYSAVVACNDPRTDLVSRWIQENMPAFANTRVRLCANSGRTGYRAYLYGPDARRCPNLRPSADGSLGQHKTRRAYLQFTARGMHTACTCTCDSIEDRVHGACRSYRSPTIPLPAFLREALFAEVPRPRAARRVSPPKPKAAPEEVEEPAAKRARCEA